MYLEELLSYIEEYRERLNASSSSYDAGVLHGLLVAFRILRGVDNVRN